MTDEFIIKGEPVEIKYNYPFRIGLISDLHIGAQHGLFPLGFKDDFKLGYDINDGQVKLWEYLNNYIQKLNDFKVNTLIVLGDIIGGKNMKELGTYMVGVDLNMQISAAAFTINHICKNVPSIEKVFLIKGTPYHGAKDTSSDKTIALTLKAEYGINAEYKGEYMYLNLEYNGKNKVVWLAHACTEASVYPETALGRDIGQFLQGFATGKIPKVDMVVRAHKHEYIELHKSSIRYMILPCWQFYVPYDKAIAWYSKWQPDIGGAILLADDEMRLRPMHFTYPNVIDPTKFLHLHSAVDPKSRIIKADLS